VGHSVSVGTAATAAKDPWQLRVAIGVYPSWWRDEYGQDAVATFADLTAARGSLPVRDVVGVLARGLALRARSSMVFWLGLTLLALEVLAVSSSYSGFWAERTWASVLVHAGAGTVFAVPLVALSAAWLARRRRHERHPAQSRLAALGRDAAAVLAFAATSYLVLVVLTVIGSGWPSSSPFDLGYTAGFAFMTISAFGVGTLLGTVLPRAIAVPAAVTLGLLAMISEGWQGGELRWRNVTGSALTFLGDAGVAGSSNLHITAVTAMYAGFLALAAIGIVAIPRRRIRPVVATAVFATVLLGSTAASGPLLDYVGQDAYSIRSDSQLQCSGTAPRVCLWPEQDATDGAQVRATVAAAYQQIVKLGVPVSPVITAAWTPPAGETGVWSSTRFNKSTILADYTQAVVAQGACLNQPSRVGIDDQSAASYGLTLLIAGPSDPALAHVFHIVRTTQGGEPYTLGQGKTQDYLGVHNREEALAAVTRWFGERVLCPTH
jgi:hypothetical protein